MSAGNSFHAALAAQAAKHPKGVAYRHFRLGVWETTTWSALLVTTNQIAAGLVAIGVRPTDTVAISGDNEPATIASVIAAASVAGSVTIVPVNAPLNAFSSSRASVVIAGDEEQHDKAVDSIPASKIVVVNTRGLRKLDVADRPDADTRITLGQLIQRGSGSPLSTPAAQATVTIGGAAQSQEALLGSAQQLATQLAASSHDVLHAQRNIADPGEFLSVVGLPLVAGSQTTLGTVMNVGLLMREMHVVQPTLVHASPRWLGAVHGDVANKSASLDPLRRFAVKAGWKPSTPTTMPHKPGLPRTRLFGLVALAAIMLLLWVTSSMAAGYRLLLIIALLAGIGLAMVLSGQAVVDPLRRRYGVSRLRAAFTTGAQLSERDRLTLGALRVPVVESSSSQPATSLGGSLS
jgi:long-subunit acyl-CoA synthetase (AMP-forming)